MNDKLESGENTLKVKAMGQTKKQTGASKKNSTSGKATLNKLTCSDVCLILEACAMTKVSKIQFGDLYVEFGAGKEEAHQSLPALTQNDHDKLNAAQVQKDAEELRSIEIDELLLTDPEKYEELLSKGEL